MGTHRIKSRMEYDFKTDMFRQLKRQHFIITLEHWLSKQFGTHLDLNKWIENLRDVPVNTKTFTLYQNLGLASPVSANVFEKKIHF